MTCLLTAHPLNTLLPAGLFSVRLYSQKLSFGAMESSGAILHAPDAVHCARLHALARKCECLRRGPWLDRAHIVRPAGCCKADSDLF